MFVTHARSLFANNFIVTKNRRLITFMKKTSPVFWIAANGFLRFHKYRMCGCFRILDASVVGIHGGIPWRLVIFLE